MSARHISRAVCLQTLFEIDSNGWDTNLLQDTLKRSMDFLGKGDEHYSKKLLNVILSKKNDIDRLIMRTAPDWPLDKIAVMDRNILRIGIAELIFVNTLGVPPKVAINEAIELAKEYGGESSGRFINGVLGKIYQEMGEPRKDEGSKRVEKNMIVERMIGAVLFSFYKGDIYLALMHDIYGYWTLPKYKLPGGEFSDKIAEYLIAEHTCLNVNLLESVGENEYILNNPEGSKILQKVSYYLFKSDFEEIRFDHSNEIDDAQWFKLKNSTNFNVYPDLLPIITTAITRLSEKYT